VTPSRPQCAVSVAYSCPNPVRRGLTAVAQDERPQVGLARCGTQDGYPFLGRRAQLSGTVSTMINASSAMHPHNSTRTRGLARIRAARPDARVLGARPERYAARQEVPTGKGGQRRIRRR
jgi:hypothetical protein